MPKLNWLGSPGLDDAQPGHRRGVALEPVTPHYKCCHLRANWSYTVSTVSAVMAGCAIAYLFAGRS